MNAKIFNDQFAEKVRAERLCTNEIISDINVAEDNSYHLKLGYSDLRAWLIKAHKMSETSATRRINAAKVLRSVPSLCERLESGATNMTVVLKANLVFTEIAKVGVARFKCKVIIELIAGKKFIAAVGVFIF